MDLSQGALIYNHYKLKSFHPRFFYVNYIAYIYIVIKKQTNMTYSQIVKEINKANLSTEELSKLNSFVVDTIKLKRKMDGAVIKQQLSVGMAVMVDHPSHKNSTFTVDSIRRTKATIVDSRGRRLNAPLSMLIPM